MKNIEKIISSLERIETHLLSQKNVLNMDDVVKMTGLSKSHLYRLTSHQLIPHYKPNNKLNYFKREEIEAWLLKNPVVTQEQIEREALRYVTLNPRNKWPQK